MTVKVVSPVFGTSYNIGWIGFTRTYKSIMGDAIAYGERSELEASFPEVNHALVVIGAGECCQAHSGSGVAIGQLSEYLDDPNSRVYFRQPLGWTPELGAAIADAALSKQGSRYDDLLIAENALADTLIGTAANKVFHDWPHDKLAALVAKMTPGEFICSFLAAYALASMPCFAGWPLFAKPLASIDPLVLMEFGPFEDFINAAIPVTP